MKFDVGILNNQPVDAVVRQVRLAESLGFETAWITDSHLILPQVPGGDFGALEDMFRLFAEEVMARVEAS